MGEAKRVEQPTDADLDITDFVNEATKLLGAQVPTGVYWDFKRAAASRNEHIKEAILHAALMYISAGPKGKESSNVTAILKPS